MPVLKAFLFHPCSAGPPFCPFFFYKSPPCRQHGPPHTQVLRDWKSIKLKASHLVLHFFFFSHFVPEGLPGSVMTTAAADLRDCPRRRKRTDVHRHIAENAASNSWGSDRLWRGWPPRGADANLKGAATSLDLLLTFLPSHRERTFSVCVLTLRKVQGFAPVLPSSFLLPFNMLRRD